MRHSTESHRDQQNREHGNRSAPPAFLTFACEERKRQQHDDSDGRTNQQYRCLRRRGQKREQRIEPKKEKVRTRGSLNNRWIRLAAWSEGAKIERASSNRKKDETGKHDIFPHRAGHEWHTRLMRQLVIFLHVRGAADDSTWHGPLINSKFQDHEQMHADECDQQPWDNENVQCEES